MFLEYCGLTKHLRANGTVGRMGENVIEDSPWFTLKYCLLSWALCWQLPSLEGPIQGGSIARSDRRTSTFVLSPAHCIALRRWSTGCPWSITPLSVRTRHVLTVDILLHMYLYVYIYIFTYITYHPLREPGNSIASMPFAIWRDSAAPRFFFRKSHVYPTSTMPPGQRCSKGGVWKDRTEEERKIKSLLLGCPARSDRNDR